MARSNRGRDTGRDLVGLVSQRRCPLRQRGYLRVAGFGIRNSDFGYRVSGFGIPVSRFYSRFEIYCPGILVGLVGERRCPLRQQGHLLSGFGFRTRKTEPETRNLEPQNRKPRPHGGVRPFHSKSTCITQSTLGPHLAQIWSRNTPKPSPNEIHEAAKALRGITLGITES